MNFKGPKSRIWIVIAGMLAIIYFINCFTPLRLTNDTVRYFAIMERMDGTWPAEFGYHKDFLPVGYVCFLMALSKLHILNSFTICFLQLLFLAGSLNYVRKIFGPALPVWALVIFTMFNWTTIKLTITPLSEMQFLFFSSGALYYFGRFNQTKRYAWLISTIVFCALAILTRTAGAVLLIALPGSLLISNRTYFAKNKMVTLIAAIVIVAGLAVFFTQPKAVRYLGYFFRPLVKDPFSFFSENFMSHLMHWAELFINCPYKKLYIFINPILGYLLVGIVTLVFVLRRVFSRKIPMPLHIRIYITVYVLLIFNWPFYEARFWFPILPFIAAIILLPRVMPQPRFNFPVALFRWYYALAGIFVLTYYTVLSYDKRSLAKYHDARLWKDEYHIHFFKADPSTLEHNKKALYILEKYD